ncbi:MAG: SAM hydrolase/SAM-dependent halogenase family protein [Solirubrobacterales bacterium]
MAGEARLPPIAVLPITFLSDYGTQDEFAGVCRAVIASIAPGAPVIDLAHGIPRHSVAQGAEALAAALPFAPPGVHLAVVDPGVGTARRAVAVRVSLEERLLVGPDNGLLWRAIERFEGAVSAVEISRSRFRLEPTSATFHGRDVFAPVAAHLALGADLADAGEEVPAESLVELPGSEPTIEAGRVVATVVSVDGYGNAALDLSLRDLEQVGLRPGSTLSVDGPGGELVAGFALTFADALPGELVLLEDSNGRLALSVNRASAARELGLVPGGRVTLRP